MTVKYSHGTELLTFCTNWNILAFLEMFFKTLLDESFLYFHPIAVKVLSKSKIHFQEDF